MAVLRWIAIGLAVVLAGVAALAVAARFSDGPMGPMAGGALEAGERADFTAVDWAFAREVGEIELQLVEPPRSRTTWIAYHDGAVYIPCGLPSLRLWKQWPHEALEDGRAVLRIEGRLYDARLVKVEDPAVFAAVSQRLQEKYEAPDLDPESLWIFRVDPRV